DGSTDGMWKVVEQLRSEGVVHTAIRLPIRSSKVTAINMALEHCTGEIVFIIDADSVLERGAIAAALAYLPIRKLAGCVAFSQSQTTARSLRPVFKALNMQLQFQ